MQIIGRKDKVDLPQFDLDNVLAKIDTGAYTSAIHCSFVEEITTPESSYLEFILLDPTCEGYVHKKHTCINYKVKRIKNSFGQVEERYIVRTHVDIFNQEFEIELSLSNRSEMRHPLLLGRKFLKQKFIVDVSAKYLSVKRKEASN